MGIRDWFRSRAGSEAKSRDRAGGLPDEHRELLTGWMAAMESGELRPPVDIHDREAWNRYWETHLETGVIEQSFNDMMSSDPELVDLLNRRGARTILCAGAGLSLEPIALALHGFDVTALDISDVPRSVFRTRIVEGSDSISRLPGLTAKADQSIGFAADEPIDPEACPPMHRSDGCPPRGGGSLAYVTGDLMDPEICPGPFDVVIERRTLQLFPREEQHAALDRLAARLGPRAFLISQQHRGNWRPGQPRQHYGSGWLDVSGFASESAGNAVDGARVARLRVTTG
jgi:hypothetical protein